ncbi:MAG: tetratricopeptide repeat protein [Acidobacteriota bacterium]
MPPRTPSRPTPSGPLKRPHDAPAPSDAARHSPTRTTTATVPDATTWGSPAASRQPVPGGRSSPANGERVGPYRVLGELGSGGMGRVVLACRDDDVFERNVAIKIVHGGHGNAHVLKRFVAERQILAHLNHPNIAQLYDGGATADGRPYFVMEPVFGLPVDRFCDSKRLGLAARLALFEKICEAVRYAHRNLVVHRDLKPSNILVTDGGVPKLLDFGIAKVLSAEDDTPHTRTRLRVMTPSYASPEQVEGGPITTATDVYSLGVLLYELLTGRLPYRFEGERPADLRRAWAQALPERPSRALAVDVGGSEGRRLRRQLATDLDNIVLKALRIEPDRRYPSVDALADDLVRLRTGHPVRARAQTFPYRAAKLLSRHRLAAVAAAACVVLLVAVSALTVLHSLRLAEERRQTAQVADFVISLFDDPRAGAPRRGERISAEEILRRGRLRIDSSEASPEVRATLLAAVGRANVGLFEIPEARRHLTAALRIRRLELGQDDHPQIASILADLAFTNYCNGNLLASERIYRDALRRLALHHGGDSAPVAEANIGLARTLSGRGDFREARWRAAEALRIRERLGDDVEGTLEAGNMLASMNSQLGNSARAEALYRRSVDAARGRSDLDVQRARALSGLGWILVRRGELTEAGPKIDEALRLRGTLLGEANPYYANTLALKAMWLEASGELDDAEATIARFVDINASLGGPRHPVVLSGRAFQARLWSRQGRQGAETALRSVIHAGAETLGEAHGDLHLWRSWLAEHLHGAGRDDEAHPIFEAALAEATQAFGEGHPDVAQIRIGLGSMLADLGDREAAVPLLQKAVDDLERTYGPRHPKLVEARDALRLCAAKATLHS